ncbi:GGDEF domain-containing protein [Pseudoteredinibacter isoporae]|uniref:diguanylate cyclase n=1 Tax=Pseudoteredinibacter isoporae TaxID=570281 RepID=A0A7X0MWS1_9GAMM|nr:GGDEF domain-containing protein [Pseudoteredinibacter isoporae]MBB6521254.1 diguanylate cyclase (GGDEF)-like protein [Pseudoteredinibacter isoporae]NHO86812.1 GGDEF domain-containing protein [Pseudoteredinibacter isoporae]NIB24736.1 GGDEF domain-containing protein [Pseudoteredinibacter isoporae]
MYKLYKIIAAFFISFTVVLPTLSEPPREPEHEPERTRIRIQLKWFHQYQFAGYYIAQEKGFFREQGLNVELIEGGPDIIPPEKVAYGNVEFGVGNSSLLVDYGNGMPIVAIAAFFQHSPFIILARQDENLKTIRDLEGRSLMISDHSHEIVAFLKLAGVDISKISRTPHTGNIHDISEESRHRVDASTAFLSNEYYDISRTKIPFIAFQPRDIGFDIYGDTLFTSKDYAESHPDTVRAVKEALIRGWRYALNNMDEAIEITHAKYAPGKSKDKLAYEAKIIHQLFVDNVVDIGYMSQLRWLNINDAFAKSELVSEDLDIGQFLFESEQKMPDWIYRLLIWLAIIVMLVSVVAQRFYQLSKAKDREIEKRTQLEEKLRQLVETDALTGLYNRHKLDEMMCREIDRAERYMHNFSIILMDVDHFKNVNDTLGHLIGDRLLREISDLLTKQLRKADIVARWGGEEFMIVCPETDLVKAETVAEKLRACIASHNFHGTDKQTASFGVTRYHQGDNADTITSRADKALYQAKRDGRDRVCVAP